MTESYIPNHGDRVIVNGGQVAKVLTVNVEGNLVTFETYPAGGGTDTHTVHLSQTRFELVEAAPVPVQPELPFEPAPEAPEAA